MEVVDNCCRFKKDGKWGLKNKSRNRTIFQPLYDDIRRIHDTDFYLKMKRQKKWGIVDCDGNYISDFLFDDILEFDGQYFIVIMDGKTVKIKLHSKKPTRASNRPSASHNYSPKLLEEHDRKKECGSVSPYSSINSLAHRYIPDKLPTQSTISARFAKRKKR